MAVDTRSKASAPAKKPCLATSSSTQNSVGDDSYRQSASRVVCLVLVGLFLAVSLRDLSAQQLQQQRHRPNEMGTVHMMCGMIASGKTTFSKELVRKYGAEVFSPDTWMLTLFGEDFPVSRFQDHGDAVKELIWKSALALLRRGHDVVLDFSFWTKQDRMDWKKRCTQREVEVRLYYINCSTEICRSRLSYRNERIQAHQLDDETFFVPVQDFDDWAPFFEPPLEDEDAIVVPCAA
eukprot:g59659.t1